MAGRVAAAVGDSRPAVEAAGGITGGEASDSIDMHATQRLAAVRQTLAGCPIRSRLSTGAAALAMASLTETV